MQKSNNPQSVWQKHIKPALAPIWKNAIKPLFVTERKETLFGERYYKMQSAYAALGPVEKDRLSFFVSVAREQDMVKDYVAYIRQLEKFCDLCVREPDSHLAKNLDMQKIMPFKTAVDQLMSAVRSSDKIYLDRVRQEMPVPVDENMTRRTRSAEISALKEDIVSAPPGP